MFVVSVISEFRDWELGSGFLSEVWLVDACGGVPITEDYQEINPWVDEEQPSCSFISFLISCISEDPFFGDVTALHLVESEEARDGDLIIEGD